MSDTPAHPEFDLSRRYHRQSLLMGFGEAGQARLAAAHAVVVGCGALGCVSVDLLVRAGVGRVTLIDRDVVEATNLQRQTLYAEADLGSPKAEAAARRLRRVNGSVRIHEVVADLTATSAERLLLRGELGRPDVIVDGTDNFAVRFVLNDVCVKHAEDGALPLVYGGAVSWRGMSAVLPCDGVGPCLRCVFDGPPAPGSQPTCDTAGVFGPVVGIVGAVQAGEALKLLAGMDEHVSRTMLSFDLFEGQRSRVNLADARRDDCPCCGMRQFEHLDANSDEGAALCGRDAVQVSGGGQLDLGRVAERLRAHGAVVASRFLVRCELTDEPGDTGGSLGLSVFHDGRAIVRGTTRPERARGVYARYVGH